jgi:hypothetical protein
VVISASISSVLRQPYVPHLQRDEQVLRLAKRIPALFMEDFRQELWHRCRIWNMSFPKAAVMKHVSIRALSHYETCKRYGAMEITHVSATAMTPATAICIEVIWDARRP